MAHWAIEKIAITGGFPNPISTFDLLKASPMKCWATRRKCIHGDLNATNVAIDADNPAGAQAYIFDAAGMRGDFEFRDLATLEITSILFNSLVAEDTLLKACKSFYDSDFIPATTPDPSSAPFPRNIVAGIRAIRSGFKDESAKTAYAVLLFSAAMQQLSGLGFQPSPNKVRNPDHACALAAWIAGWLTRVAPQFFPTASGDSNGKGGSV